MEDDRRAVQLMFREVLQRRGFNYCDEGVPQETQALPLELRGEALLEEGLGAGSTDHFTQSVRQTLEENGATFWSSRGSASPDADDWLLYKMRGPACLVACVQLVVFRARYQFGEPLYPPVSVSFQVGPSPTRFAAPTPRYPVRASSQVQSFLLPATCPAGRYVRVNLHGRRQQQLEDMQWYLAIERVEALGHPLPPSDLALLRCWSQGAAPLLPSPGSVPAYVAATTLRNLKAAEQQQQLQEEEKGGQGEWQGWGPPASCYQGGDVSSSSSAGWAGGSGWVGDGIPCSSPHPLPSSSRAGAHGQQPLAFPQQQGRQVWVPGGEGRVHGELRQAPEPEGLPGWLGLFRAAAGGGVFEEDEDEGED